MQRVLLTAHQSRWLLDLAVAARPHLAAADIDLSFWAVTRPAARGLADRGATSLFPATLGRLPRPARTAVRGWYGAHRARLLAGDPVDYHGVPLDLANAYESRIRRADLSALTRLDLGRSGAGYVEIFERHLARFAPDLLILWWGEWAWSRVGAAVAARRGIPVLYFERGPFPGSAQLDPAGANGGATIADPDCWRDVCPAALSPPEQLEVDRFREGFAAAGASSRPQPARQDRTALAAAYGVPLDRQWLFLPAQETTDAVAAIADLTPALRARPSVTLVVKPHPADRPRTGRLRRALDPLGAQGRLAADAHVHDLIAASDWTVTVSSSVGLEAALLDKPVLVLRRSLYSGKGFTCDLEDYGHVDAAMTALTAARALSPEQLRARDRFCHYLITRFLLWGTPDGLAASAVEMSRRIQARVPDAATVGPKPVIPPDGWSREPTAWLSTRDAYRDLRDRLRSWIAPHADA